MKKYYRRNRNDRDEYETGRIKVHMIDSGWEDNDRLRTAEFSEDDFRDIALGRRELTIFVEGMLPHVDNQTKQGLIESAYFQGYMAGRNDEKYKDTYSWKFDLRHCVNDFREAVEEIWNE